MAVRTRDDDAVHEESGKSLWREHEARNVSSVVARRPQPDALAVEQVVWRHRDLEEPEQREKREDDVEGEQRRSGASSSEVRLRAGAMSSARSASLSSDLAQQEITKE